MERTTTLLDHRENVHSQYGEDGMFRKLFELLGVEKGYFCEFGAWDGQHLSNAYNLYTQGWSGCYIEANRKKYKELCRNISEDRVTNVCAMVMPDGENSLDNILSRADAPKELDLLSIDIDSEDLSVWKSVSEHAPKCVIIEYNPTIPIGVRFENKGGGNRGNSSTSICECAGDKGYVLVAQTKTNLLFLRKDLFETVPVTAHELQAGTNYFFGYDGTLFRHQNGEIQEAEFYPGAWGPWAFLQPVPRWIRKFGRFTGLKALYSLWCILVTRPLQIFGVISRFFSMKQDS